jgi:hypothetical protein
MTLGVVIVLMLFFSVAVLFVAMNIYRRQRLLADKKAEYNSCRRNNASQWSLFRKAQANIDRIKNSCTNKQSELFSLLQAVNQDKIEIKDTLEILKRESSQTKDDFGGDLERIIERRKMLVKKRWNTTNGKKALFIERRKELQNLMGSMDREVILKDKVYAKWLKTKTKMDRIRSEYSRISTKPISAFEKDSKD